MTVAHFISPDTIVPGIGDPQAWNRYAYVLGNPLRYTDPSGHCVKEDSRPGGGGGWTPTESGTFNCTAPEFFGLPWWLQELWVGLVNDAGKWNDGAVDSLKQFVLKNGLAGQQVLFGGTPWDGSQGCWATGKASYSCPVQPRQGFGIVVSVPADLLPEGQAAVTIWPFNLISDDLTPEYRDCIIRHEKVHNAQVIYDFYGNMLAFSMAWVISQVFYGDEGNSFEIEAEAVGCG